MSTFGNPGRTRMAKITSSGSFVSPYSSSVNNFSILSIDSYEDKIYVGGSFFSSSVDFTPTNRIASIDPLDGSHDTSFNVGTGFNSTVNTIKVDGSGKVLAGGTFTTYSGSAASRLARLNVDGTLDTGFNNTITNITPRDIDIDENDKIITVNDITVASSSFSIVRFNTDGSQDATLNSGTGFTSGSSTNTVETVKSDLSGSIYVGGRFIEYSGSARNRVVRLNTDGTIDDDFNVGTGFNRTVWSIEIDNSGKVLVGGEFDEYSGSAADKIIRLNTDGTIDAAFTPPPFWGTYEFSGSYSVRDIEVQSDDKIVLGGYFSFIEEDKVTEHIVRLNSDGSTDLTFFGEEIVIVRSRRLNRIIN